MYRVKPFLGCLLGAGFAKRYCFALKQGRGQYILNPSQALAMHLLTLSPIFQFCRRLPNPSRGANCNRLPHLIDSAMDARKDAVTEPSQAGQGNDVSELSNKELEVEANKLESSDPTLEAGNDATTEAEDDAIVQFIVVRRDLLKVMGWPVGSVIAQGSHASSAVLFAHSADEHVMAYHADLLQMRTVVKECKGETQLLKLAEALSSAKIVHHLWIEEPERIPTAIALKPYPRSIVAPHLKKFSLFK